MTMRALRQSLVILICLVSTFRVAGQIYATNTSGVVSTNRIGQAEAIKVASHLTNGMREEDAKRYLEQHGLGWNLSVGDSFGWSVFFPLTNGGSLGLDIKPRRFRADGEWRDGLLEAAFIQSNCVNIVSITLRNAPPTGRR